MRVNDLTPDEHKKAITVVVSVEALEILNRASYQSKVNKSQIVDQLIKSLKFD